jgi:hypothetical protein
MRVWRLSLLVFIVLFGCAVSKGQRELSPTTSERIAELKQLCYSVGRFTVEVPDPWRPVTAPGSLLMIFARPDRAAQEVMYAHAVPKSPREPLAAFVASDIEHLRYLHPFILAAEGEEVPIPGSKKKAWVTFLEGDSFGNRSIVAFVDEGSYVGIIGFSSRRPELLESEVPGFQQVVRSYRWIG